MAPAPTAIGSMEADGVAFHCCKDAVFLLRRGCSNAFLGCIGKGLGVLMTCAHCVETLRIGDTITAYSRGLNSNGFQAKIFAVDPDNDVALLVISASDIPGKATALQFHDTPLSVTAGMRVTLLGYFSFGSHVLRQPGTSRGTIIAPPLSLPRRRTREERRTVGVAKKRIVGVASYTSKPGTSGSPVLHATVDDAGDPACYVVGVHCRSHHSLRYSVSLACIKETLLNWLGEQYKEMNINELLCVMLSQHVANNA
ncbi:hypothetical protein VPH35_111060 [Triticum aestivum]